jgi:N6-L-threonylcarbamoyladenine synthase
MRILAIETSCDETAISIVDVLFPLKEGEVSDRQEFNGLNFRILANNTISQIDIHKEYGGVFPMLAKREHARALVPLLVKTLQDAKLYKKTSRHVIESPLRKEFQEILEREAELFGQFIDILPHIEPPEIDAIAVTQGPGLEPALWVGINFAQSLSLIWKKPIIPTNHMEGHLLASLAKNTTEGVMLSSLTFPAIGLLVSGGHTELVLMRDWKNYEIIGETKDDAVGEAFDKVARMLGLPYPGGPEISRLALSGRLGIYPLPRPMLHSGDYSFSFSGLKTAVLYLIKKLGAATEQDRNDIAREFEEACAEVLVTKTLRAVEEFGAQSVIVGGGVSANTRLREQMRKTLTKQFPEATLYIPEVGLSTDNALMIAIAAAFHTEPEVGIKPELLRAQGNLRLG